MSDAAGAGADPLEELLERFLDEKPESMESFLRRYPEHADELREVLPALEMLRGKRRALDGRPRQDGRTLLEQWRRTREQLAAGESLEGHSPSPGASVTSSLDDYVSGLLARVESHGYRAGRIQPEGELARGGQGVVLAAWDETLRRRLAMKVALPAAGAGDGGRSADIRSLGRFLEEAQVTAQLDHPGIVPVYDLGLDPERRVYFTMKLVKGRDLRAIFELVRTGEEGWNETRALNVLLKVCEAMAYAHSKGVIHRDLKPSNVMVGKFGEVYVMDWGLARVLGTADKQDIRIQPALTSELRSARREASEDPDSPLVTMDGDVVGTPAFMSPEQARGEIGAMGPHSDVYAVGAMLYQLLTGQMPYVPAGEFLGNRAVWALVLRGPPDPVQSLVRNVPAELDAICEKAMARDIPSRYADMGELADDLRAYLEQRVVLAHQSGALIELKKWIQRNRALAAALAVAAFATVVGLVSSLVLKTQSDANAARAASERADVLRLSALQRMADLEAEAEALWPPWPEKLQAYGDWLARAAALQRELDPDPTTGSRGHRARLAELEARALLYTDEERDEDRRSHPRFAELATMQARLASLRRAHAVREGRARIEEPEIEEAVRSQGPLILDNLASPLVVCGRTRFGDEARGLALARMAVAGQAPSPLDRALHLRTLAWALAASGLDEQALPAIDEAIATAPEEFKPVFRWGRELLREDVAAAASGSRIEEVERELEGLERELAERRTWRFVSAEDQWWHAQLRTLVGKLEELADLEHGPIHGLSDEHGWGIARRQEWALRLAAQRDDAELARRWEEAIRSIAAPAQCAPYRGLVLEPELDLVPLGRDPRSGLWEFAHPLTGTVPERDEKGSLVLSGESGLVFVLLPGATYLMGAQRQDPAAPNYDPEAATDNAVCEQTVAPFFLSKYELTQGQWHRLTGRNPSYYNPSLFTGRYLTAPFTDQHPVEQVSWLECMEVCRRMGLTLPNEAQWEYAARAGTSTIWWTGDEREALIGAANLADRSIGRFPEVSWPDLADWPEFEDGYAGHAPVGRFAPNPFGLHDVSGNLQEWCRNAYDASNQDPTLQPSTSRSPALRGGAFQFGASLCRSANRQYADAEWSTHTLGLRPARELHGEVRPGADERRSR